MRHLDWRAISLLTVVVSFIVFILFFGWAMWIYLPLVKKISLSLIFFVLLVVSGILWSVRYDWREK